MPRTAADSRRKGPELANAPEAEVETTQVVAPARAGGRRGERRIGRGLTGSFSNWYTRAAPRARYGLSNPRCLSLPFAFPFLHWF